MATLTVSAETGIAQRFREVAAARNGATAVAAAHVRFTYAEIDRWSEAIAADLIGRDAPLDRPVSIVTRDAIALVPAILGAVKAGHFFIAIDAAEPAERIAATLATAGASLALDDTAIAAALEGDASFARSTRDPHALLNLVLTSGTTGTPKAIANRQYAFVARSAGAAEVTGRAPGARVSYTALPGFGRATSEILGSLLNGATLCAFDARKEPLDALGAMIERERVEILTLTPALFRRFMKILPPDLDLSSVRKLRIGADVMTPADVESYKSRFLRSCSLERAFNCSEAGMVMHMTLRHDTPVPGPLVPIGRPLRGVAVRLIDDDGNDVAIGEPGELVVTSAAVADGYWRDPELTARKFRVESGGARTFFTGDLVKRDEGGLYYFVGRKDARLKIHGRRIDPLEIESALVRDPAVREAVVAGQPDADGELRLAAYVVAHHGADADPRGIRARLRTTLPAWLVPSRIHLLDAMPMTRAGKVDRHALASRVETAPEIETGAATDETERTLLEIWSRATGLPVGIDDDFFEDLGGESVVAAHLVADVKRVLGRAMPLSLLLELNTVGKMADYLRTRTDRDRLAVVVQPGTRPPLFCVSGKGGSVIVFRQLAALLGPDQPVVGLTHDGFHPETFPRTFAAMAACYVDAIRATQPTGPYFLAGYSAGGFVAFDMARQLMLAGETVAFVGLIDTGLGGERTPYWTQVLKYAALLRQRPRVNGVRFARAVGRRLMGRGASPAGEPDAIPPLQTAYEAMRKREALQPYAGRVTLFVARHGLGSRYVAPEREWTELCDGVDVVRITGEHHTILRDDAVSLAEAMRFALDAARDAISS